LATTACESSAPSSSAARFDFRLDEDTARLCRRISLDDLPAERVWGEIEKLLLQATRPSTRIRARRSISASWTCCCLNCVRSSAASRSRSGTRRATSGSIPLMVIDKAHELNNDLDRPRLHHGDARGGVP
jgi:tRNA nucleotidyltransferase (CCA-adding enzyme)